MQSRTNQGNQEGRQRIEKRIGGEGVARAHRRRRNRPKMPTERRHFGEGFLDGFLRFSRKIKGRWERGPGGI
jgi:hypothetical protein